MSEACTPGNWRVDDTRSSCVFVRSDALHPGAYVAIMDQWSESNVNAWPWREAALANARLIAAAPDLLAALECITDQLERVCDTRKHKDGELIDTARAVIAKAIGAAP